MSSRSQIDFIRHGQSEHNLISGMLGGKTLDVALSERGIEQATKLGIDYPKLQPHAQLMSSIAVRAVETAQLAFPEQELTTDKRLVEISRGKHEGKLKRDVYTPKFIADQIRDYLDHTSPDGESLNDGANRMMDFLEDQERGALTVAVGHSRAIKALAARFLGLTDYHEIKSGLSIPNTSVTRFENNGKGWQLSFFGKSAREVALHDRKLQPNLD